MRALALRLRRFLSSKPDLVLAGVLLVALVSSIWAIHSVVTLEEDLAQLYRADLKGGDDVQDAQTAVLLIDSEVKDALILTGTTNFKKLRTALDTKARSATAALARAASTASSSAERALLAQVKTELQAFVARATAILTQMNQGAEVGDEGVQAMNRSLNALSALFVKLHQTKVADAKKTFQEAETQLNVSLIFTIGTLFLTVLLRTLGHGRPKT